MFWKLFAICIVYVQLEAIVESYSGLLPATPFHLINWVLSFPAAIAVCCYVFRFPVGDRKYWQFFAWVYSAEAILLAVLFGHHVRRWFYIFPNGDDPIGTCVGFLAVVAVFIFRWIAIWRYGNDEALWRGTSDDYGSLSNSKVASYAGTALSMVRRYRSLQCYVGVFVVLLLVFVFNRAANPGVSDRSLYEALGPAGYFYAKKAIHGFMVVMAAFCVAHEFVKLRRCEGQAQRLASAQVPTDVPYFPPPVEQVSQLTEISRVAKM